MRAVDEIREQLESNRVIVVAGAGVTVAASQTAAWSWAGLLSSGLEYIAEFGLPPLGEELTDLLRQVLQHEDVDGYLAVASVIESRLGAPKGVEWARWLRHLESIEIANSELVNAIHRLNVPIVTTNYDDVLRRTPDGRVRDAVTWKRPQKWLDILRGVSDGLMYLHGWWDEPDSVVLGVRSYEQLLSGDAAQSVQRTIAQTHSLLFVGCGSGLDDPNIGRLMNWVSGEGATSHRHYILLTNEDQRNFRSNVGLHGVAYGANYDFLPGFLEMLADSSPDKTMTGIDSVSVFEPLSSFVESAELDIPRMVVVPQDDSRTTKVTYQFALGEAPVTFNQWEVYRTEVGGRPRPRDNHWGGDERPVINISWFEANEYIDWLNSLASVEGTYRLPTEEEWQYVARAGTDTSYWWGDEPLTDRANFDRSGLLQTTPVYEYDANPFHLFDTLGNVWEWCSDEYLVDVGGVPADSKVVKGGCWYYDEDFLTPEARLGMSPDVRFNSISFRVARTIRQQFEVGQPYLFIASCSGLAASYETADRLDQTDNFGSPSVRFVLVDLDETDGTYTIREEAGDRHLGLAEPRDRNEALIQLFDAANFDDDSKALKWIVDPDGDGYVVRNLLSGKVLDVYASSTEPGAPLIQFAEHGNANQRWHLRPALD